MKKTLQIIAIVILLLCLFRMPYDYYTLARIALTGIFGYLAYTCFRKEEEKLGLGYSTLVALFQPFFKITMHKTTWNIIDVGVALLLLFFIFKKKEGL